MSRRRQRRVRIVEAVRENTAGQARRQPAENRVVGAPDDRAVKRHARREGQERLLQVLEAAIALEVLAVDVRDHGVDRREQQERAIALVGLGDEQVAAADARAAAELRETPPDHDRRIQSRAIQHEADHRGRGRLAVRAGDGDALLLPHHLCQQLAAQDHRDAAVDRLDDLRIRHAHGRRADDDVDVADVGGVMSLVEVEAKGLQVRGHGRCLQVRSAHVDSATQQNLGQRAHPAAADANEMRPSRRSEHGR